MTNETERPAAEEPVQGAVQEKIEEVVAVQETVPQVTVVTEAAPQEPPPEEPRPRRVPAWKKPEYRFIFRLTALALILALLAVAAAYLILPDKAYSASEKRILSGPPSLTLDSLASGRFMDEIEDYAADQFPLRDFWMKAKTTFFRAMNMRESQGVYLLSNGGLAERFDTPDEQNFTETTDAVRAFSERYPETPMYFLLAPTAVSVLKDLLPKDAVTESQDAYIERLFATLPEGIRPIDVRAAFRSADDPASLYYRTDHHWTTKGALLAYTTAKAVMGIESDVTFSGGVASNSFRGSLTGKSGFTVDPPDELTIYLPENAPSTFLYTVNYPDELRKTASVYDLDSLVSDDPYTVFFGSNHPLIEIDTTADTDRTLLVIKDSYANSFIPFALTEFARIVLLDPRYYYDDIDVLMKAESFTDVLFLYNVNTLAADTSLKVVLTNVQ